MRRQSMLEYLAVLITVIVTAAAFYLGTRVGGEKTTDSQTCLQMCEASRPDSVDETAVRTDCFRMCILDK